MEPLYWKGESVSSMSVHKSEDLSSVLQTPGKRLGVEVHAWNPGAPKVDPLALLASQLA